LIKTSADFALRGSNVKNEFSISKDLYQVDIDEGQISQVINNLVINADQAMPEGGTIYLKAENTSIDKDGGLPLEKGNYIQISIQDQGIGISKEHLPKIFDPYFTTKQKGSGLGLATCYSIIKNHDGLITAESELGNKTIFYIYLPASEKPIAKKKKPKSKSISGKGKVLIMDDEDDFREIAFKLLSDFGYEVELAKDGSEAIELYERAKKTSQNFDVIVMDLTIPGGVGGKEAMEKLIEIDPHVKAIVSSGYHSNPVMANYKNYGFKAVLPKPYQFSKLNELLHAVISETNDNS